MVEVTSLTGGDLCCLPCGSVVLQDPGGRDDTGQAVGVCRKVRDIAVVQML